MEHEGKLLTAKELMERLKISEFVFHKMRMENTLPPHVMIGNRRRFPEGMLQEWIKQNIK